MSDANGEKEDYQSDSRATLPRKGAKRDNDLVAAVLIFTLVLAVIGLYAMTYMFR
jgi:hypothetical protein